MSDDIRGTPPGWKEQPRKRSLWADFFIRLIREKPLGLVGGIIVLILFFTGIFADFLAPYPMAEAHISDALSPPSSQYLLGTDHLGRDLLSRVIFGARVSMIVGLAGSSIIILIATVIGLISGFLGGKFDLVLQRFVDAWLSFPFLVLLLSSLAVVGTGLWQVIVVSGIILGVGNSRIIRSAVIGMKQNTYVEAAVAIGNPTGKLLIRHILPNVAATIIVVFTVNMSTVILAEAMISFLGYGIPPPTPSWGGMLTSSGLRYMLQAPWIALWPGLALALVIYGINMLGDAVRDLLDPRLKGGLGRYGGVKIKRLRKTS